MLIVLTSERELRKEAQQINSLFESGLEILHFRKPSLSANGYRMLLNQIEPKNLHKIMIHQYHELCSEFNLKGIHIQEQPRLDLGDNLASYVSGFKKKGFKVSSSFHKKNEIKHCLVDFDYMLLSPVFNSISKIGYNGKGFDVSDLHKTVIAMGGINETTIQQALQLGYKSVGVLGGVWNVIDSISGFINIKNAYEQAGTVD